MGAINPKITNIAIGAVGTAMTNVVMTILASKVEIIEDPSTNNGVQQGLTGFYIDTAPPQPTVPIMPVVAPPGSPTPPPQASPQNVQVWLPNTNGQIGRAYEPILFGGQDGRVHGGQGDYVGAAGTVVAQLTTNTPNAGGVLLVEYP